MSVKRTVVRIRRSGRRRTPAGYGSACGFGQTRRRGRCNLVLSVSAPKNAPSQPGPSRTAANRTLFSALTTRPCETGTPRIEVVARTHNETERTQLLDLGARQAVLGERELAIQLARFTLRSFTWKPSSGSRSSGVPSPARMNENSPICASPAATVSPVRTRVPVRRDDGDRHQRLGGDDECQNVRVASTRPDARRRKVLTGQICDADAQWNTRPHRAPPGSARTFPCPPRSDGGSFHGKSRNRHHDQASRP